MRELPIENIKQLLYSDKQEDKDRGRNIVREQISLITDEIVTLFLERQELMKYIAEAKKNNEPIFQFSRELELLYKYESKHKNLSEEEKEFLHMIIRMIMAAGKEKQRKIL
jgi:chorismate mutase